jgi:ankyrin repeat protein
LDRTETETGFTALFYAVLSGNIDVVQTLLEAGANRTKVANDEVTTPLSLAGFQGEVDMVDLLE